MKRIIELPLEVLRATRTVLRSPQRLTLFLVLGLGVFWVLVLIPVKTVPGNDIVFQLSIMTPENYLLFISLSLLTALSVVMQWHLLRQRRQKKPAALTVYAGAGGASVLVASVFGAVTCSSCAVALFGFLGTGVAFTMIQYRNAMVLGALAILSISLYFTARKINAACETCFV